MIMVHVKKDVILICIEEELQSFVTIQSKRRKNNLSIFFYFFIIQSWMSHARISKSTVSSSLVYMTQRHLNRFLYNTRKKEVKNLICKRDLFAIFCYQFKRIHFNVIFNQTFITLFTVRCWYHYLLFTRVNFSIISRFVHR